MGEAKVSPLQSSFGAGFATEDHTAVSTIKPTISPPIHAEAAQSTAFPEKQTMLNKDGIDERLNKLIPDVYKMWFDQTIEIEFRSGDIKPVMLRKPAFVTLSKELKDQGKICWTLVAPTVVKNPKYTWTIGSEHTSTPNTSDKTKKFAFPFIIAGKNNYVKKVSKQEDLEDLKKLWRGMKFLEDNLPKQKALPVPEASRH